MWSGAAACGASAAAGGGLHHLPGAGQPHPSTLEASPPLDHSACSDVMAAAGLRVRQSVVAGLTASGRELVGKGATARLAPVGRRRQRTLMGLLHLRHIHTTFHRSGSAVGGASAPAAAQPGQLAMPASCLLAPVARGVLTLHLLPSLLLQNALGALLWTSAALAAAVAAAAGVRCRRQRSPSLVCLYTCCTGGYHSDLRAARSSLAAVVAAGAPEME